MTVTDSRYSHIGDMMRNTATGEVLYVTGNSIWNRRVVEQTGFGLRLWRWARRSGPFRPQLLNDDQHTLRVYPWKSTGLPHRLP